MKISAYNTNNYIQPFKAQNSDQHSNKNESKSQQSIPLSNKKKAAIFMTTLAGVSTAMLIMFKKKNMPMKSAKDFFRNLTTVKYNKDKHEVEKLVGYLAGGSVLGGLLGGVLFDKKENFKAKLRESIIQTIGNIGTPLLCVAGGMRLFDKYENKILDSMEFLKGRSRGIPGLVASGISLVGGIVLGNKVGNFINQNIFHTTEVRKLKLSDMSPHIDDLALATSLVASQSSIGPIMTRIIPAALMIAGYSTGTAQEGENAHH